MTVAKRRQVSVPLWLMITLLITWGGGYLMLSSALTRLHTSDPHGFLSVFLTVLYEVAKAIIIGSSAGLLLKYLLPDPHAEVEQATMADCGVSRLYRIRADAHDAFKNAIHDSRTRQVRIAGISLRDFFYDNSILKDVWSAITDRMLREDTSKIPLDRRLHVRLLLLDPLSSEGYHRYQIEQPFLERGLRDDVPVAVQTVLAFRERLTTSAQEVLQVHLYSHGSFGFQFITDSVAIAEQYSYRDQRVDAAIPIIEYSHSAPAYEQLTRSFDIVWRRSQPPDLDRNRVGVAAAIEESRLGNIFRASERLKLGARQRMILQQARAGDIIDIQAISARFYMQAALVEVEEALRDQGRRAKVRVLVTNPVSRAAIMRAVADNAPIEEIGMRLADWTWESHRSSPLYTDVWRAIHTVIHLRRNKYDIDLRLTASELSCAMLLAQNNLFVEQYAYGRSRNFDRGTTLGGEHAVFEYERLDRAAISEERILQSAFEVLWDSYSISLEEYRERLEPQEQDVFEQEKRSLLTLLDGGAAPERIRIVILAAGYGTRMAAELERIPELRGRPKALLRVGDRTILDWIMDGLRPIVASISDVTIVTNDLYIDMFERWRQSAAGRRATDLGIKLISNGTTTPEQQKGAVADLHFAITREDSRGNVFVIGADNIFEGDFQEVVETFLQKKTGMVVVHDEGTSEQVAGKLGVVEVDGSKRIISFEEKPDNPRSTLASTLCYLLTDQEIRLLKRYVRENPSADDAGEFIKYLVEKGGRLEAFEFSKRWHDVGTFADYRKVDRLLGGDLREA